MPKKEMGMVTQQVTGPQLLNLVVLTTFYCLRFKRDISENCDNFPPLPAAEYLQLAFNSE